jgi:hypothetical protein
VCWGFEFAIVWSIFLFIFLLALKAYDRVTNKLVIHRDKLIITCPFRVVTILFEKIKWIRVWSPFIWNRGNILIIVKCRNNIFPKIFRITTFFLNYPDRKIFFLEIKNILEREVKSESQLSIIVKESN